MSFKVQNGLNLNSIDCSLSSNSTDTHWTVYSAINILLMVSCFSLYAEVRHFGFVWDTIPLMLENSWIHSPGWNELEAMFTEVYLVNWQPIVWLSHAIDFQLFGDLSGLHHLSNVAYHGVNSCLIFALTLKILNKANSSVHKIPVALLTAFIFLAHPQHVQSVAWLVERKDTLSVFFSVLLLITYLQESKGIKKSLPLVFFIFALMSKPMAVTLPLVLVLLDVYPLKRCEKYSDLIPLLQEKWHYFLLSFAVGILTLINQQAAMPGLENLPLWVRCLNAINNSLFYMQGYLWPINLSPFYPYPRDLALITQWSFWLPGLLFLIAVSGLGLVLWRRGRPELMLLWLFYLITLAPVSGIIHVGPAKALDYYVYFATLPVGLLIALAFSKLAQAWPSLRTLFIALATFYCLALFLVAKENVLIWQNDLSLWSRANQLQPSSAYINRNLAAAYVAVGELKLALVHAEQSESFGSPDRQYLISLRQYIEAQKSKSKVPDQY